MPRPAWVQRRAWLQAPRLLLLAVPAQALRLGAPTCWHGGAGLLLSLQVGWRQGLAAAAARQRQVPF